jgi:hypothetical protein
MLKITMKENFKEKGVYELPSANEDSDVKAEERSC